jgi:hypothetical protein
VEPLLNEKLVRGTAIATVANNRLQATNLMMIFMCNALIALSAPDAKRKSIGAVPHHGQKTIGSMFSEVDSNIFSDFCQKYGVKAVPRLHLHTMPCFRPQAEH